MWLVDGETMQHVMDNVEDEGVLKFVFLLIKETAFRNKTSGQLLAEAN